MGQVKNQTAASGPVYEMITTSRKLDEFVRSSRKAGMVAVDLEADSMYHYREKVCLIQMAADGQTVVIDPLRVKDLTVLNPLFRDASICKVFHGADYDVRSLYRDFGIQINNLFDTQVATMYLGYRETGLESVVSRCYGVELNKKYQKKDWSRRPLPDDMIAYAASDVVFLIPLAKSLMRELEHKGRLDWVREECRLLSRVRPQENNGPMFTKIKGAGRLSARHLATLEALLEMRNRIARQKDRPLFKVIGNAALLKLAVAMPSNLRSLKRRKIISDKQIDMYGAAIIEAVKKAQQIPRNQLPTYPRNKSPRLSPRVPARVKVLRNWRDQLAAELNLDPALLFNRALIRELAIHRPQSRSELETICGIHQWQINAFGRDILALLKDQR